jgi:hypothetical protein
MSAAGDYQVLDEISPPNDLQGILRQCSWCVMVFFNITFLPRSYSPNFLQMEHSSLMAKDAYIGKALRRRPMCQQRRVNLEAYDPGEGLTVSTPPFKNKAIYRATIVD